MTIKWTARVVYDRNRVFRLKIWGLTDIERAVYYDIAISFRLPSNPEASQDGESRGDIFEL